MSSRNGRAVKLLTTNWMAQTILVLLVVALASLLFLSNTNFPLFQNGLVIEEQLVEIPLLNLQQTIEEAPFTLRLPTHLPRQMKFMGGHVMSTTVILSYNSTGRREDHESPWLAISYDAGVERQETHIADSYQEQVIVNQSNATFGSVKDQDFSQLSWLEDGIFYEIRTSGAGLGREELVRIAEGLK